MPLPSPDGSATYHGTHARRIGIRCPEVPARTRGLPECPRLQRQSGALVYVVERVTS